MDYDWKKIFETKTNKELYEIYSGKTLLPNETVKYSQQELERRNFDFNNMEVNTTAWKLSNLLIEEDNARKVINENNAKTISYTGLYILISVFVIIYIFLLKVFNYNIPIIYLLILIGITVFYVLFTNYLFNKKKQEQEDRIEKINQLIKKLEVNVPNEKLSPIKKDIIRNIEESIKGKKVLNYILIGFILIFLIFKIIELIV